MKIGYVCSSVQSYVQLKWQKEWDIWATIMSRQAGVASASERVNVEEVALVHILTGVVQVQPWPLRF